MKVAQGEELFARSDQRFKYIVDRVVFLEYELLLVNLDRAFEVNTVVEEFHQWLHVEFVLDLLTGHRLDAFPVVAVFIMAVSDASFLGC